MVKLRVSEVAKLRGVSVQTIYKAIKKGALNTVKEDGITYVLTDDTDVKPDVKAGESGGCNELLTLIKSLDKQVKTLSKELKKCHASKEGVMVEYIKKLSQLQLPSHVHVSEPEDAIDVVPVKKKSKKKKRKNKKKK